MKRPRDLWPVGLLVVLLWIARYWHSPQFGLYEDDLTVVPRAISLSPPELLDYVGNFIVHLYDDGRPLFNSLNYLLSALGWRTAGLIGPYLLGFLIESVNVVLFYTLIRRLFGMQVAAFAGVAYVLYSADTTQAWLHRSLGAEPSLTLLFLALHAYISNRLVLAYGLAAVILFSYESPYTVFLCAPLFTDFRGTGERREWIRHLAITLSFLGAAYVLRLAIGTERVTGFGIGEMLATSVIHALEGPLVSLGTYALRPLQVVAPLDREALLAAALSLPVFLLLLTRRWGAAADGGDPSGEVSGGLRAAFVAYRRPLLAGLAMLILAYLLTFTVRAYATSGRDTRVHFAAGSGAALTLASLACIALASLRPGVARWGVRAGLAAMLALLLGYGFVIQSDYIRAWELQRSFWRDLLPQIQDAGEGTVVIVDPAGLTDTVQIGANTWNLPRILAQLYRVPPDWDLPPRVYRGLPDWREYLVLPDGSLRIDGDTTQAPEAERTITDWDHLIVIHTGRGVVRREEPLVIDTVEYPLVEPGSPNLARLPRLILYDLLIGTDGILPAAASR
jgi:hypothetical protein